MAIISKILSLPSATQYEGQPTFIQGKDHIDATFGSSSASTRFYFSSEPTDFWKNKASTAQNCLTQYYDSNSSSWIDTTTATITPGSSASFSSTRIGIKHRARTYARINGTDAYSSTIFEYYPQTRPGLSPSITSYSASYYQFTCTWANLSDSQWGGAPSGNGDRQYRFIIEKNPGTPSVQNVVDTYIGESTSYTFNASFSGSYRMVVYAYSQAGPSTFLFPNAPTIPYGSATPIFTVSAPPPPPPPPYFCIQADTPIMTWFDDKIAYKKAKDITVGDRLVSYSFEELPKYENTYDVSTWSSDSFTPISIESADVMSIKKHTKDQTVYFNNDINTRMSFDHSVFVKRGDSTLITTAGLVENEDIIFEIDNDTLTIFERKITAIDLIEEETDVFEIDCNPYDVFFAGNMLTHNYKPPVY